MTHSIPYLHSDWITSRMPTKADADADGDVCIPLSVDAAMGDPEDDTVAWAWAYHGLIVPGQPWWSRKAAADSHAPRTTQNDPVNQPPHYTAGKIEVIEILEQTAAGAPDPVSAGLQWQTLKYLLRMWLKGNPAQDAQKARWYLDRLITRLTTT
jgi:hypothetical protein